MPTMGDSLCLCNMHRAAPAWKNEMLHTIESTLVGSRLDDVLHHGAFRNLPLAWLEHRRQVSQVFVLDLLCQFLAIKAKQLDIQIDIQEMPRSLQVVHSLQAKILDSDWIFNFLQTAVT